MTPFSYLLARHLVRRLPTRPHSTLELGARVVPQKWHYLGMPRGHRQLFGPAYTGADVVDGPGVTWLMTNETDLIDLRFNLVFSSSVIEHMATPISTLTAAHARLAPRGAAIHIAPSRWREHNNPDYWRVMPDGMWYLLEATGFETREISVGSFLNFTWGFATKKE